MYSKKKRGMHDFFLPLLHATDTRSRQFCMTHGLLSPSGIRALQLTSSSKCPGNFSLKLQKILILSFTVQTAAKAPLKLDRFRGWLPLAKGQFSV